MGKEMNKSIKKNKLVPFLKGTYPALIKNSVGSKMFNNYYAREARGKRDILNNGDLSCAFFISSILKLFGWIDKIHLTVNKTEKDLIRNGWEKLSKEDIKIGSIIIWEKEKFSNGYHRHIGFYIGNKKAVSTNYKRKRIIVHNITFNGKRNIEAIYWKNL